MRFRLLLVIALGLAALGQLASTQSAFAAAAAPRKVISWVAPYAIQPSLTRLKQSYNGVGPKNSLTHLALQFWTPTSTGGLARSSRYGAITNATINSFVTFAHNNGIKVLLCVYNGEYGWDWTLVQASIKAGKRDAFITALINEMQARNLDGIDVDLEGAGQFEADKGAYVAFVKELARRVHLLNKIVTVDSFPWKWNAPNWNWWPALFPHVDGINSMGYEDLGRNANAPGEGWRRYNIQKGRAGSYAAKLQIGLPSYLATWQGNTTLQQVQWFRTAEAGRVGIAIWDAQFTDASWKSAPVWNVLKAVRQTP